MSIGSCIRKMRPFYNRARGASIVGFALTAVLVSRWVIADPPASLEADPVAATPVNPNGADTSPQVTIQARRALVEHQAAEFVRQVTRNPQFRDESLPRWNAPICFAVAGLSSDQGRFALGRLGEIARAAGARVAPPGCHYNFFVMFVPEPDKLLTKAFHRYPKAFDQCDGLQAVREFIAPAASRAVRVWHNVRLFRRDGMPIGTVGPCGGMIGDGEHKEFALSLQYFPSRIERYDVLAFSLSLVVIDTAYPKPAKLGALVDLAALVGLADIDLNANFGDAPSILRLFDASTAPAGLTDWDRAFLSGLYHSDQATLTQRSQIAVKMSHDIVP